VGAGARRERRAGRRRAAESRPGVTFLRRESDRAVYRIESGAYVFESRW